MTKHCEERIKERANLGRQSAEKLVNNAYMFGITSNKLPAKERSYMQSRESEEIVTRYYSGYCFIFSINQTCITMFHAPEWFLRKSNYHGKERIRNPKKYFTKYCTELLQ